MFKFTTLLPEKEKILFNQCYSDYRFKKTFDEVSRRYDIIELAKKANKKREEIKQNDFIYSSWRTFDGEHINTGDTDSEGWHIKKFYPPVYSVQSDWVESMCDALFDLEGKNIPTKRKFHGIVNIRKFRNLINPMNDENKDRAVIVTAMYNDKITFVALSLPCDYILGNWWMRLFYEIRSLEHLNEYKKRFIQDKWIEKIAYTIYIYKFKYGLHMWCVAQKYVKKRFCKSKKEISKIKNKINEQRINEQRINEQKESVNTTSTVVEKTYTTTEKKIDNILDINDISNVESERSISIVSSLSDDEDKLEQEATETLFGNSNEPIQEENIQMTVQRADVADQKKQDDIKDNNVEDIIFTVSVNRGERKSMLSISSLSSEDEDRT